MKDIQDLLTNYIPERFSGAHALSVHMHPNKLHLRTKGRRTMSKSKEKTNVMRILEQKKIDYKAHTYEADGSLTGEEVAKMIGKDNDEVFKTLVTEGKSKANYVFVIPVHMELDLKKASEAVGEKNISMVKSKELLGLTGYIHGGCSPIGMKKFFKTYFHKTLNELDSVIFNAGKIGFQVELNVEDIGNVIDYSVYDLCVD